MVSSLRRLAQPLLDAAYEQFDSMQVLGLLVVSIKCLCKHIKVRHCTWSTLCCLGCSQSSTGYNEGHHSCSDRVSCLLLMAGRSSSRSSRACERGRRCCWPKQQAPGLRRALQSFRRPPRSCICSRRMHYTALEGCGHLTAASLLLATRARRTSAVWVRGVGHVRRPGGSPVRQQTITGVAAAPAALAVILAAVPPTGSGCCSGSSSSSRCITR